MSDLEWLTRVGMVVIPVLALALGVLAWGLTLERDDERDLPPAE